MKIWPDVTAPNDTSGLVKPGTKDELSAAVIAPSPLVSTCVHLSPGPPALLASTPFPLPSIQLESPTGNTVPPSLELLVHPSVSVARWIGAVTFRRSNLR